MNKEEIEKEDRAIKVSMPLLTQKEMLEIDNNFNEIVNKIKKQFIKGKDLAIAQYIIDKQQKQLEQKESILDKVIDKLKEDIEIDKVEWYEDGKITEKQVKAKNVNRKQYVREILNIIEGGSNGN